MASEITLNFDQKEEDLQQFNLHVAWTAPHRKRIRWRMRLTPLVIFTAMILLIESQRPGPFPWGTFTVMMAIGIVFALTIDRVFVYFLRRRVSKNIQKQGDRFLGHRKLKFAEDEILVEDAHGTGTHKWSAFFKVEETPDYYYLYVSTHSAFVIPKWAFVDEGQQAAFKTLLEAKISETTWLQPA
ncbi:MAG: YcxB family protein [Bacteroidota bacterium]